MTFAQVQMLKKLESLPFKQLLWTLGGDDVRKLRAIYHEQITTVLTIKQDKYITYCHNRFFCSSLTGEI